MNDEDDLFFIHLHNRISSKCNSTEVSGMMQCRACKNFYHERCGNYFLEKCLDCNNNSTLDNIRKIYDIKFENYPLIKILPSQVQEGLLHQLYCNMRETNTTMFDTVLQVWYNNNV